MNAINYMQNKTDYIKTWTQNINGVRVFDELTYNQYESNNPLRLEYSHINNIKNDKLRQSAQAAQYMGAEILSAYINPYYLSHKIINLPSNISEIYQKYSAKQQII